MSTCHIKYLGIIDLSEELKKWELQQPFSEIHYIEMSHDRCWFKYDPYSLSVPIFSSYALKCVTVKWNRTLCREHCWEL